LVDDVAPSTNPLWYLAPFAACATTPLCSAEVGNSLSLARRARPEDRAAFFAEADQVIAKDQLFIPIARPLRWSLVTPNLGGFAENARAIHPLNRLASTRN
jgi:peptide/nickel transport system substrate-binding protein